MRIRRSPSLGHAFRRPRAALLAAGCFVLLSAALPAAADRLTPPEYARHLGQAAQGMERAAHAKENASLLAQKALSEVPERAEVPVPPSTVPIPADNRDLLKALNREVKRGPTGMAQAARTLRSLQAGLASAPAPPDGRGVLTKVLARREFHPSLWQRLREWYADLKARFLRYLLEHLPGLPASMHVPANLWRIVGYAALFAAGLVVVLLVTRLVLRLTAPPPGEALPLEEQEEPVRPSAEWLAEAERQVRAGRYGPAIRALYLAALMRLDATGRLSYDRTRADGRFVRALEAKGDRDVARELLGLCRLFSRTWYGLAPAGAVEYDEARQVWDRLEAMTAP